MFHSESVSWNIDRVKDIHREMLVVMGLMKIENPELLCQIFGSDMQVTACGKD